MCFGGTWRDPVTWAHYADKHHGICLGFEIPDDGDFSKHVNYVSQRIPFPSALGPEVAEAMLFTKYSNWQYEQEIRMWAKLDEHEDGLYFYEFGETLRLVTVIVGARSTISRRDVNQALGSLAKSVSLVKARAGFQKFEIVRDRRGLH